jgi:hypothetical protein
MPSNATPTRAREFAPLLCFRDDERHLPGSPDEFRRNARFRESNFDGSRDRGWNRSLDTWVAGNQHGAEWLDVRWGTVTREIAAVTGRPRDTLPPDRDVTRPRDSRNHWGEGSTRGFFLELAEGFGRARSGSAGPPLPIYYDLVDYRDADGGEWKALSYWFFFVFNWNVLALAQHEGDWEHITLYFSPPAFADGGRPELIFYASHNDGFLVSGLSPSQYAEDRHPIVYVHPNGHPSYPIVPDPGRYDRRWRTWEHDVLPLDEQEWARYDGAWGEVGETVHTTGPLGPWFKRGRDRVKIQGRR